MEVHHSGIGLPSFDGPAHARVIQRQPMPEPPSETLLGADVVAREHVQPSKAAQHDVLCRPASDATDPEQSRAGGGVILFRQPFKIDIADDPAIQITVPAIDRVAGPPAKSPDG